MLIIQNQTNQDSILKVFKIKKHIISVKEKTKNPFKIAVENQDYIIRYMKVKHSRSDTTNADMRSFITGDTGNLINYRKVFNDV
jgi:hypothetical protein